MTKKIFFIRKVLKVNNSNYWSKEEDEILIKLTEKISGKFNWKCIASQISKKNHSQCYRRFKSINPSFKKGKWEENEDQLLQTLLGKYGNSWTYISKIMGTRSSRQIRNRYDENLNPMVSKDKFSLSEDKLILQLHNTFHNNWSKYVNYLPKRCVKVIKRRYLRLLKMGFNMK